MRSIILISGKAEHGKDSVAKLLKNKLGEKVFILHYGDYVKDLALRMGWNGKKDEEGRSFLTKLGNEFRQKKSDFWINPVVDLISVLKDNNDIFIVPDTRHINEIHIPSRLFWNYKIITLRIERINYANSLTEEQKNDISENELNNYKFDYILQSESGLDNLESEVDKFIPWLNKKIKDWSIKKEKRSK
jgi:phosphomevalonate kinase